MKYLLDSDAISAVFDPKSPFFDPAKIRLENLSEQDEIYISSLFMSLNLVFQMQKQKILGRK